MSAQDYFSAKAEHVGQIGRRQKAGEADSTLLRAEDSARVDLASRLEQLIGDVPLPPSYSKGETNFSSLFPDDMGGAALDGLLFKSGDSALVIASTRELLVGWLRNSARDDSTMPTNPLVALAKPETYSIALDADAAVGRYADLTPDAASANGVVAAMLVHRAQDIGDFTPDEVIVSVLRGERAFIALQPARVRIPPPAECVAARDSAIAEAHRHVDAYYASGQKDTVEFARYSRGEDNADAGSRECYARFAARDPQFAPLRAQVRDIAAMLPR